MRESLNGLFRLDIAEKKISELVDQSIKMIQITLKGRGKRRLKIENMSSLVQ